MKIQKALIIRDHRRIEPFDETAAQLLVLNRTLSAVQDECLSSLGITPLRIERRDLQENLTNCGSSEILLIIDENIFFTPKTLELFIQRSVLLSRALERRSDKGADTFRACAIKGLFCKQLAILQDAVDFGDCLGFEMYITRAGSFDSSRARKVKLDLDQYFEQGNFPDHMLGKDSFKFALTSRPLMAVTQPIHIGLLNMAANLARVALFRSPAPGSLVKSVFRAVSAGLRGGGKGGVAASVLSGLSQIHPSAIVHPTAVVEGSIIGPGARVGAYAVIRFSVIGEGAFIDDHAGIKFSIIGDGAYIANNNVIFFTTAYPGAFLISGPYQFCCFGRDTAIMNSIPSDYRLDNRTIQVRTEKGLQDTGLRFAGSIVGHGTRIAAGLIIAPGRVIPGGLTLYPDPARVLSSISGEVLSLAERVRSKEGSENSAAALFLIQGKLCEAASGKRPGVRPSEDDSDSLSRKGNRDS